MFMFPSIFGQSISVAAMDEVTRKLIKGSADFQSQL